MIKGPRVSAIPRFMTIDLAYRRTAAEYDPQALSNIDFVIPATLNNGRRTAVSATSSLSPYTNERVYLTQPSAGAEYFIPNLFVRNDGSVELPAYQDGRTYKFYPLVTQNWDATQRYTVINQTK